MVIGKLYINEKTKAIGECVASNLSNCSFLNKVVRFGLSPVLLLDYSSGSSKNLLSFLPKIITGTKIPTRKLRT